MNPPTKIFSVRHCATATYQLQRFGRRHPTTLNPFSAQVGQQLRWSNCNRIEGGPEREHCNIETQQFCQIHSCLVGKAKGINSRCFYLRFSLFSPDCTGVIVHVVSLSAGK